MTEVPTDIAYKHVARSAAPIETVWSVLADHAGYSSWSLIPSSRLEKAGRPAPNGVGAIRFLGGGPIGSREQIVTFEPPRRLGYRIVGGLPVASYRAETRLEPSPDGGTVITWTGGLTRGPGPLRRVLTELLGIVPGRLAHDLARAAEAREG